jgi:hypothetical protein
MHYSVQMVYQQHNQGREKRSEELQFSTAKWIKRAAEKAMCDAKFSLPDTSSCHCQSL